MPDVWQFAGYEKPFYINVAYPFPATPPYVPDCAPGAVYNRKFSYKKAKNLSRSIITFQGVSAGFDFTGSEKYEIECKEVKDGKTVNVTLNHDINPLGAQKFSIAESLCGENVFVELTYKRNGKICGSEQHIVKRTLPVITQKQGGEIKVTENEKFYIFDCCNVKYYFSKHIATFEKIEKDGKNYLSDKKSLLYNPYAAVNAFVPNIYRYKIKDISRNINREGITP